MDRNERVTFTRKPDTGLIPRGVIGREFASGRIEWSVSKGDLIQAHKQHIRNAAGFRDIDRQAAAHYLQGAAIVRRMLTQRKRINTLDILRGRA